MITYVARRGSGARWGTMGALAFVGLLAGALCFVAAPRQATHSLLLPDYDYSAAVGSGPFPWEEPFVSPSWPVVDIRIPDFGSLFQSSPPSPPPPLARARLMDWTMAFISVDTHTEVPVNVQIGDTAQKQALDATVDLTKTAVAGSQGYVAADGFVPAHASSSGSGGRLGDEIGAGRLRSGEFAAEVPPCRYAGETGCLVAAPLCHDECGEYLSTLRTQGVTDYDGVGVCDDGGEGSEWGACALGSDCSDCGPREAEEVPSATGIGSGSGRGMAQSGAGGGGGASASSKEVPTGAPSKAHAVVASNPTLGTLSSLSDMLGVKALFTPPPPPPPNSVASFLSHVAMSIDNKLTDTGLPVLFADPPPPPPDVLHALLFD